MPLFLVRLKAERELYVAARDEESAMILALDQDLPDDGEIEWEATESEPVASEDVEDIRESYYVYNEGALESDEGEEFEDEA